MQEITFTLRTITPLFLAGADQAKAELRAPTFRGIMRYWYRALVAGLVGTDPRGLEKVIAAETALFGATDTGSAISIKVSAASHAAREFTEPISVKVAGKWQATGKGYLLWSMAKSGRVERNNLKPARWYFPAGTSFKVTLSARSDNRQQLQQAVAAFWLLTHLGSIGSRSRRCAGSLAIQHVRGDAAPFSFDQPQNVQMLKQQIEDGIREAKALLNTERHAMREAQFDALAPAACRIWILQDEQSWASADKAMEKLGEKLQDYRYSVPIERRKIFGLPLPPILRSQRRASPLLLRVVALADNKYVGVAVLFKTTGNTIYLKDYAVIEQWVNEFKGKIEVML